MQDVIGTFVNLALWARWHSDSELSCVFKGSVIVCVWEVHVETSSVSPCSDSELSVWDVHDSTFRLKHVPTANYMVQQISHPEISRCVWEVWALIPFREKRSLDRQRTACLGCSLRFLTGAECSDSELPLIFASAGKKIAIDVAVCIWLFCRIWKNCLDFENAEYLNLWWGCWTVQLIDDNIWNGLSLDKWSPLSSLSVQSDKAQDEVSLGESVSISRISVLVEMSLAIFHCVQTCGTTDVFPSPEWP